MTPRASAPRPRRWWLPGLVVGTGAAALLVLAATSGAPGPVGDGAWWLSALVLHLPLAVILCFLAGGLVERAGYFWRGRSPSRPGVMPRELPTVCVQLPMFDEHAVAVRAIEAACALVWPPGRLAVQVLDDSTDADTRALVEATVARLRATGADVTVLHRTARRGYKAGALEVGRRRTDAEFLAILDADFVPEPDFLLRTIPHFYRPDGSPDEGLALVQAQWGHLNHDESALTRAQSLWVDDHHTLQMSWRSAQWRFVNFTGTAGVWRASAITRAGGWRADSLVEDCELSFRALFAGYRTAFVKEVVVPAELPATFTAYKAQQRRWTRGWVQLQRLHLASLASGFRCSWPRRVHLLHHMCVSWQWPAWALWVLVLPYLIAQDLWFGAVDPVAGIVVYLLPGVLWTLTVAVLASLETRHTYPGPRTPAVLARRIARVLPHLVLTTGMLPHQFSAFAEGLFGSMHGEFERTPKAATVTADPGPAPPARRHAVRVPWPHVLSEVVFVALQAGWVVLFAVRGLWWCALGAGFVGGCVLALAFFYGDHAGRVLVVVDRAAVRRAVDGWSGRRLVPRADEVGARHRRAPARAR
jgi:cellulose synthase/poly-beta-1,6-N-acetylglucosamine synthase-like glycosyltransferase